jgi:hypothetical protein
MSNHEHPCEGCGTDMRYDWPHDESTCKREKEIDTLTAQVKRLTTIMDAAIPSCQDPKDCLGVYIEWTSATQWKCARCCAVEKALAVTS